jgi:hypothetical protein
MDCGERDFTTDMAILNPDPGKLLPLASNVSADVEEIYTTCAGGVDMGAGQFVSGASGETITSQTQPLPGSDQFFDPAIPKLEIAGSASGRQDEQGVLRDSQYSWTLTLCRIVNGAAAC